MHGAREANRRSMRGQQRNNEDSAQRRKETQTLYVGNDALFHIRLKEFKAVLTPLELSVFECCIVRDLTMRGYEEEFHVDKSKVSRAKKSIQEKYKKFF